MRCAIYIRKSREERDKPSHRLTVQREQLPTHARAQGWVVEIYDDGHASAARGKADDLKERARLEQDIRGGKIQVILTIELSRLSRDDTLQDYVGWLHLCSEHGVKLATPSRTLDPSQHSDWMLLLMEGGFSSVEMKVLQGRMAEGRRQAFLSGKWLGGAAPPPYTYDKSAGKMLIDPSQLPLMQQLWDLAETHSAKNTAELLNLAEITVRRAISDDRLLLYQSLRMDAETGNLIPCDWDPVMDAARADRIRSARRTRRNHTTPRKHASLLSGLKLLTCGYCGRTVKTWNNSRTRLDGTRLDYYGCQVKNNKSACTRSRFIAQPILNTKITTNLFGTLEYLDDLQTYWTATQSASSGQNQLTALDTAETTAKKAKARLVEAIAEGLVELIDARPQMEKIKNNLANIHAERETLLAAASTPPDWASLAITRAEFEALTLGEQREFLRIAIKEIRLFSTYALIKYPFPRNSAGDHVARVHIPPAQTGLKTRTPKT